MNRLPGKIIGVERCGSIALVDVEAVGHRLTATLVGVAAELDGGVDTVPRSAAGDGDGVAGAGAAGWQVGAPVLLLFSETEVALAKNLSGLISMRNRLQCELLRIERGTVLTKVTLGAAGHTLVSVITTRSARTLALEVGDAVEALVKANEMHVAPDPSGTGELQMQAQVQVQVQVQKQAPPA